MRPRSLSIALAAVAAATLTPRAARAVDPFEIQVYDGTANDRGQAGLELHVNHVFGGHRVAVAPELPPDGQTHVTLEPSFGVTDFWEVGGYLQSTLRDDGHLDYAGVKLRSKLVTPPRWHPHLRLGINVELSVLPAAYDRNRVGGELRPIVAWEEERWVLALNPIVGTPLAGDGLDEGPTFEPALLAMWKVEGTVGLGLEYYADLGPIAHPDALRGQQHYLYEVASLLSVEHLELNVGIGEGLTGASAGFVVKTIIGYGF